MLKISKERWVFILAQAGVLDGATLRSLATSPGLALITFGRSTRLHSTSYVTHRVSLHVNNLHRNRERAPGVYTHMHANVVRALSRARDLSCGCATVYIFFHISSLFCYTPTTICFPVMPATSYREDARLVIEHYMQAIRNAQRKLGLSHCELARVLRMNERRLSDMCVGIIPAYFQYERFWSP